MPASVARADTHTQPHTLTHTPTFWHMDVHHVKNGPTVGCSLCYSAAAAEMGGQAQEWATFCCVKRAGHGTHDINVIRGRRQEL